MPWLQRLRERWSGRLRVALSRCLGGVSTRSLCGRGVTTTWKMLRRRGSITPRRRPFSCLVRSVEARRVTPLCSLAALAAGLVGECLGILLPSGSGGTRDLRVGEERRQCQQDGQWYTFVQTLEFVYNRGGDMDFAMRTWNDMGRNRLLFPDLLVVASSCDSRGCT